MESMDVSDGEKQLFGTFMGASVMDLISYVDRFPVPGETLSGNQFRKGTGGKAANACVMAARLGLNCRILAKIGCDSFGEEMVKNFKEHNISTDYLVFTNDAFTSTASITVTRKGENNIVYVPGATNLLTPDEIRNVGEAMFKDCRLFVSTFECVPESLHTALSLARKFGVPTLVNGAPPFPKPMENSHIYALCDILCVNETEAHLMTKLRVDTIDDCRIACKMILDKGCGSVILTMGANGAMYVNRNQTLHIPVPRKIEPVDTTGAGDSFMGALAFYLVHFPHLHIEEQIKRCNTIASATVLAHGTQSSFPYRQNLPPELFKVSAMVVVLCNLGAVHLAPTGRLLSGYELSRLIRPNQLNTELAILEYGKGPNETHSRLSPSVAKLVNPGQQQVMVWLSFFKQLAAYVAMIISISFMFLAFFLVFLYLQHRHELKLDEVSVSTSVCNLKNIFFKRQALVKRYHRFAFAAGLPYHAVDPSTVSSTSSESYSPETLTKLVSKSSEMIAQHQARKNARGDLVHLSDTNIKYTTNKDCM